MASGSKRLTTGVITATVFVLAIGGLAAYGAGYFDQDADTTATTTRSAPDGNCCPITGGCDETASATKAADDDAGCCPSTSKGCAEQAAPDECGGDCEDCEESPAGCDGQEDCDSKNSCESCPTDN